MKTVIQRTCLTFTLGLALGSESWAQRAPVTDTPLAIPRTINTIPGPYLTARLGAAFGAGLRNVPFSAAVGAGVDTGTPLRLEGLATWLFEPHQGVVVDLSGTDLTVMFNGIYRFTGRAFSPYAVAGVGGHYASYRFRAADVSESTRQSSTTLALTFGAGLESVMSPRFSLCADVRYMTGRGVAPGYWHLTTGALLHLAR